MLLNTTAASVSDSGRDAWLGLDVSSQKFDCSLRLTTGLAIRPAELRQMTVHEHKRTKEGLGKAMAWAKCQLSPGDRLHLVMEATGPYSAEIAAWMKEIHPMVPVTVMPALIVKNYISGIGLRNKTDKLDARAIACYGAQCQPAPSANHAEIYLQLRAITRTCQIYAERATEIKNQLHANDLDHVPATVRHMIHDSHARQLALLDSQRKMLENEMKKIVKQDNRLSRDVQLLCTIQGIGFLSAVTVLGELGDLRLYKTSRQLTACAGLNPVIHQSGEKTGKSHISKQGSSHVRRCLYLNTMTAIRYNKRLRERQQKLVGKGKPGIVALTANMRVLLTIMRALLISDKPYDPDYLCDQTQAQEPPKISAAVSHDTAYQNHQPEQSHTDNSLWITQCKLQKIR